MRKIEELHKLFIKLHYILTDILYNVRSLKKPVRWKEEPYDITECHPDEDLRKFRIECRAEDALKLRLNLIEIISDILSKNIGGNNEK